MLPENDVNQEPVTPEGVTPASPAEPVTPEPEGTVEAPLEPVTPEGQEEQQVPYNRFKEVNDAKKAAEERERRLMEMLQRQQTPQTPQQPSDPYQGMDAETRLFYQNQEKMMRRIAEEQATKLKEEYARESVFLKQTIGNLLGKEFTRAHPDIKEGSMEQEQIVQKIRQFGYDSDDAYWSVMGPRGLTNAKVTAQKEVKQQFQAKRKANVETTGIQPSGLPPAKKNFKEDLRKEIEAEGGFDNMF